MSKYNVDLMLAVRDQITMHPETHYQGDWALKTDCGTKLCIAGHAAVLAGETLLWEGTSASQVEGRDEHGWYRSVESFASEALGLELREAEWLFHGAVSEEVALARLDELIEKGKNQS